MRVAIVLSLSSLLVAACVLDWDALDPSLGAGATGGGTGGTAGTGGVGGTSTGAAAGGNGGMGGDTGGMGGTGGMEPLGEWSTPQIVPALSHPEDDDDPTMTADGLEVYFNSQRNGNGTGNDIWVSTRASRADGWSTPTLVAELSTVESEGNHTVSPDGLTMWINSNRDDPTAPGIIYVATRADGSSPWSTPEPADDLNVQDIRDVAGVTSDGLVMLGHINTMDNASELVLLVRATTTQPWGAAVPVMELNSASSDSEGWLSPDGLHAMFGSNRTGGLGSGDLYFSSRASLSDPFDAPFNETVLNTSGNESDPTVTSDLRYVLFARAVGANGEREIFEASR